MRIHVTPFKDRDIESFTRAEVLAHYERLAAVSPSIGKRFIQLCSAVTEFYSAWHDGAAIKNVFSGVRKLKLLQPVPQRTRHLNEQTLPVFFSSLPLVSQEKQVVLLLLLYTGCRQREITDLLWNEINLELGVIVVPGHRRKVNFDLRLVLSEVPLELIRRYWKEQGRPQGNHRVFRKEAGRGYQDIVKASNIDCRCHDLRRTFCSIAGGLGIPDIAIKKLAGHKTSDITAQYVTLLDIDAREYNRRIVLKMHELGGVKTQVKEGKPRLKMDLDHAKKSATMSVTLDQWSTQYADVLRRE